MDIWLPNQPLLTTSADPRRSGPGGVGVYALAPDLMDAIRRYLQEGGMLQSLLRIAVNDTGAPTNETLPDVLGRHQIVEDGIRFIPDFPFVPGVSYRASFDPRPLACREYFGVVTDEFCLPKERSAFPEVTDIFPSSEDLPENLLRFYVCFSIPMQRGRVAAEISLLGPDGKPAPDVLYRAPIELWDRSMRNLTILLDPGRLKRGVGPNRELGPPLKTGQRYTLAVGAGMTGSSGDQLPETVYKHFCVTDAVRKPISVEEWKIVLPETNSRQALTLLFPRPLDWALLSHAVTVASAREQSINGAIVIDPHEKRWTFTPASPWAADSYQVRVASTLEDVCGNSVIAAFDRPLRPGSDLAYEVGGRSIPFKLA